MENNIPIDLKTAILKLKKEQNALILAHNYQEKEIQDIADFVGDSLGLAYQAQRTNAQIIAFCGVHFMAETAKIINPTKTVVLPDKDAGCSLEESCPANQLAAFLDTHKDKNYYVVAYINCSAEVKALSDVICTSGNAVNIVNQAPQDQPILFIPDANLGTWVMERTNRKMDLWNGNCYVHMEFTQHSIQLIKNRHPDAIVIAHPECTPVVRLLADEVCSTEKMIYVCKQTLASTIIIVTESGMLHRLRKECPDKIFIPAPTDQCGCSSCHFMKMNTLEKLYLCLKNLEPQISFDESIRKRAEAPLLKMLEQSK